MIPILSPEEARAADAAAPEPVDVLIGRAGAATAAEALDLLGGAYGRRVVVVAGKGNNGADGREAARLLRRRGVRVTVLEAQDGHARVPRCDLVVDAAYGTGFRGTWSPPDPGGAPVLAVDIPSGLDARTGVSEGAVLPAARTVTFAGWKAGLLLGRGPELAGAVVVADIGLDASTASALLVEDDDVRRWRPARPREAHKWQSAVWVVAGSPGMTGAAALVAGGALRAGAGYVRSSVPGGQPGPGAPIEAVGVPLPARGWADEVVAGAGRFGSVVVGPGLGRDSDEDVRRLVSALDEPLVVDGDGITALGRAGDWEAGAAVVLTPHDGEFASLLGERPGADRFDAARRAARTTGCVVLLKGPTTVVAEPAGRVLVAATGAPRLATAGTGDVLAGIVGALLARGVEPAEAAAAGAHLHGLAARMGPRHGLVASDLVDLLPAALSSLEA